MIWAGKIFAKIIMSRIPLPYDLWKSLGIFRHGQMDSLGYPLKIFNQHINRAYGEGPLPKNTCILELGPGDSIASALLGFARGAQKDLLSRCWIFCSQRYLILY